MIEHGDAFSQENFATRIGVSRQTLSSWERGDTEPLLSQAHAMAEALGVTIDELADHTGEHADVR